MPVASLSFNETIAWLPHSTTNTSYMGLLPIPLIFPCIDANFTYGAASRTC